MRDSIKETYEQYHRTMEGITLTRDDKEQINMEIDVFFEAALPDVLYFYKCTIFPRFVYYHYYNF